MPIHDFATVRCYSDADGVDVSFPKFDGAVKDKVKELKGSFNGNTKRWRVTARYARKDSGQIVAMIRGAIEAAAPEWWTKALPGLCVHACVTRKYEMKIDVGGMRVAMPSGHPLDYTFENFVPGAVRDGRTWLVPPDGVKTKEARKAMERILTEDKKVFAEAAKFIGPRRIGGSLAVTPADIAALRLEPGQLVAVDRSFLAKADPEMPTDELLEWCLTVEEIAKTGDVHSAILRYADLKDAFMFLRARRANPMPSPALGGHHAVAKFEKQKPRRD